MWTSSSSHFSPNLSQIARIATQSFAYDNNGNRTSDSAQSYTIATGSNRYSAIGANSVSYTSTGNITGYGSNAFTYNKANQMASASNGISSGTYTYDAFGQRAGATISSSPQTYIYDAVSGDMIAEIDNGYETDYAYLEHIPVASINVSTGAVSYLYSDHLGTPQLGTDTSQNFNFAAAYQPFGATTPSGTITQNLRFPGQFFDNTHFNHNGFRDYDPATGRYLESDPLGLAAGANTYAYVRSNPGRWIDLQGEVPLTPSDLFNPDGSLSPNGLSNSTQILPASKIKNPAVPPGYSKMSTYQYCTPSGNMETHYYQNEQTGEPLYGLDYKTVPSGSGPNILNPTTLVLPPDGALAPDDPLVNPLDDLLP